MSDLVKRLRELLAATTPQHIDTAEVIDEGGTYECPFCRCDGYVDGRTFVNYDGVANGVQFFGVGEEHKRAEVLFRETIAALPALLDRIERLEAALRSADAVLSGCECGEPWSSAEAAVIRHAREKISAALDTEGKRT